MNNKKVASELIKLAKDLVSFDKEDANFVYSKQANTILIYCVVTPSHGDTMKDTHAAMKNLESEVEEAIMDGKNYGVKSARLMVKEWEWLADGYTKTWELRLEKDVISITLDELFHMFRKYQIRNKG